MNAPSPGRLLTLEGIEGVGKSTQVGGVRGWIEARIGPCVATREPGGTPLGEALRGVLLDAGRGSIDARAELLLMFAARAEHLARVLRPALARGAWVVCDRFTDASYAYQGGGRGIDAADIEALERLVQRGLEPDLTLLFDLPVDVALARARGRSGADRFEQETVDFFERVRGVYLARAAATPARWRVIDATGTAEQVAMRVRESLDAWWGAR